MVGVWGEGDGADDFQDPWARRPHPPYCLPPDIGQPGTEIFNMPAITGAGNHPSWGPPALCLSSHPTPITMHPGEVTLGVWTQEETQG